MLSPISVNRFLYPGDFQVLDNHEAWSAQSFGLVVATDQAGLEMGVRAYQANFPPQGYESKPVGEPVRHLGFWTQRVERYSSCE